MKTTLIVLLGCNILSILYDRVNTATEFVKNNYISDGKSGLFGFLKSKPKYKVDWFLTGGVKSDFNLSRNAKPEAEIMMEEIKKQNFPFNNFIIDTNSTNTAENFIFLYKYLTNSTLGTDFNYDDVYIVTSKFHHPRAKSMIDQIIPDNNFHWLLGNEETTDLIFWENYHIKNAERDVYRALNAHNITIQNRIKDEL